MPKEKTKKRAQVKDLPDTGRTLTASELKNVKGGVGGPCDRKRLGAVGPCNRPLLGSATGPCDKRRN